jgi:hypothetical protein
MYVSILEFAGNGPKWRFRARQAAATFFASYAQIWPFPSFSRWRLKDIQKWLDKRWRLKVKQTAVKFLLLVYRLKHFR